VAANKQGKAKEVKPESDDGREEVAALESPKNPLAAAKLRVMADVHYVRKHQPSDGGGLNYSYLSEEVLVEAMHAAFLRHGLTVTPTGVQVVHVGQFKTVRGVSMNHSIVVVTYRTTHAQSGLTEDGAAVGEAMDTGDKSIPKAMTIAYKYLLRESFLIPTGDDPDRVPSEGPDPEAAGDMQRAGVEPPRPQGNPQPGKKPQPDPRAQNDESFKKCKTALAGANTIQLLDRYRTAYKSRQSYTADQVRELEALYEDRKKKLAVAHGNPNHN
jgi:hypothetical protein